MNETTAGAAVMADPHRWYWLAYGYALNTHMRSEGRTPRPHAFAEWYVEFGSGYGDIQAAWWAFVQADRRAAEL